MSCPIVLSPVCGVAGDAAAAGIGKLADTLMEGFGKGIELSQTYFVRLPTPDYAHNSAVTFLQTHLLWITWLLAVGNVAIAGARVAMYRASHPAEQLGQGLARMWFASWALGPAFAVLTTAGHAYASWVLGDAGNGSLAAGVGHMVDLLGTNINSVGLLLGLGALGMLSALVQCVMLFAQAGISMVCLGVAPLTAAGSGAGEHGKRIYERVLQVLLACGLYVPLAASIYALAFTGMGNDDVTTALSSWTLLVLAVIALPALIPLMAPVAEHTADLSGGRVRSYTQTGASGAMQAARGAGGSGGGASGGGGGGVGAVASVTQISSKQGPSGSGPAPAASSPPSRPSGAAPRPAATTEAS